MLLYRNSLGISFWENAERLQLIRFTMTLWDQLLIGIIKVKVSFLISHFTTFLVKNEETEANDYLTPEDNKEEKINKLRKSSYKGSTDSFELLDMISSKNSREDRDRRHSELEDYIQDTRVSERTSLGKGFKGLVKKSM